MQYTTATTGRIFIVKFEHGDDLHKGLEELAVKEDISFATITFLGALTSADIVAGPEKPELPAVPTWLSFADGREVVGFGTIARKNGEVSLHIHATLGKGEKALAGCLRKNCEIFITVEAIITELKGARIAKKKDDRTGYDLMAFN